MLSRDKDSDAPRLISDKVHPLYDTKNHKKFISGTKDKSFVKLYNRESTEQLL